MGNHSSLIESHKDSLATNRSTHSISGEVHDRKGNIALKLFEGRGKNGNKHPNMMQKQQSNQLKTEEASDAAIDKNCMERETQNKSASQHNDSTNGCSNSGISIIPVAIEKASRDDDMILSAVTTSQSDQTNDSISFQFKSPGPSVATVQQTLIDGLDSNREELSEKPNIEFVRHRPSIVALKSTLDGVFDSDQGQEVSTPNSEVTDSQGLHNTAHEVKPKKNASLSNQSKPVSQKINGKAGTTTLATFHKPQRTKIESKILDPDSGYMQHADVILNRGTLQSILDRERQRLLNNKAAVDGGKTNTTVIDSHGKTLNVRTPIKKQLKREAELGSCNNDANKTDPSASSFSESKNDILKYDGEPVHVVLKWRNEESHSGQPKKVSLFSPEISAALKCDLTANSGSNAQKIRLEYDPKCNEWAVPDLYLFPGIYRFQFIVDGELTHSKFLPTATDDSGKIVNWFEVLPGYKQIEPYRDETNIDQIMNQSADSMGCSESEAQSNSEDIVNSNQKPGHKSGHSLSSSSYNGSEVREFRNPTLSYSDYAGISRSSSIAVTNGPLGQWLMSGVDLAAMKAKKSRVFTNVIPKLYRINETITDEERIEISKKSPFGERPSFTNRVVDCDIDTLFDDIQRQGDYDVEGAERFFLMKYPLTELPLYLNSSFLNKLFQEITESESKHVNHIIPHVNLNHLLTSSIRDDMISVACTTRYSGKFITQVMYAPCGYELLNDRDNSP